MLAPWTPHGGVLASVPPVVLAAIFLGSGAIFVFFGWRAHRLGLIALSVLAGGLAGALLAPRVGIPPILMALALGIVAGFLSVFLEKLCVFLMGGGGGVLLLLGAHGMFQTPTANYIGAGVAFIIVGGLAVFLWRPVIIVLLAVFGAWLIADAVTIAVDQFRPGAASTWAAAHPWIFLAAILAVAALGFYFQEEKSEEPKEQE